MAYPHDRKRFDAGESATSIADSTGIMFSAVYGIAHRKTWRDVTDKPGPITRRLRGRVTGEDRETRRGTGGLSSLAYAFPVWWVLCGASGYAVQ